MADLGLDNILKSYKVDGKSPYGEAEAENWSDVPLWISTGCIALDYAIGGFKRGRKGGIPVGKAIEINGMESTAKSTLLDHIIRETLKLGGAFFLCDSEHAHEVERMRLIGCDLTNFRFIEKPKALVEMGDEEEGEDKKQKKRRKSATSGNLDVVLEEFFDIAEETVIRFRKAIDPGTPVVIGLDSLAAIETVAQAATNDPNMKDKLDTATVMSHRFKGFCQLITKMNGTVILVNQLRTKPGVNYGDPIYSPGGDAKNFYFSLRIRMNKVKVITADEDVVNSNVERLSSDVVGVQGHGKIVKNKVAEPFREFRFPLYFDERGILFEQCFAQMVIDREKWKFYDSLEKKTKNGKGEGNTFYWKGEELGLGERGLTRAFLDDPTTMWEMEEEMFV